MILSGPMMSDIYAVSLSLPSIKVAAAQTGKEDKIWCI